jgi:hypothetical protein
MESFDKNLIKREIVIGSKRFSNYFWGSSLFIGGLGFFFSGLSSYLKINILPFTNSKELIFIPQGIIMTFYGTVGIIISFYIFLTIIWDIGSGYNEFNKKENLIKIVRKSFPGKNKNILLIYPINIIKSVKLNITEGLNNKRIILLCTKDDREIPISPINETLNLSKIEEKASELALFLQVKLEGL